MARIHPIILLAGITVIAYLIKKAIDDSQSSNNLPDDGQTDYTQFLPEAQTTATQAPSGMSLSSTGRDNIATFEGYRKAAYQDVAGNWTIGVGHLIRSGDGLSPVSVLSDAQILSLFEDDLSYAENTVKSYVTVPLAQGQYDALVDFTFNLGAGNLAKSTLLQKLNARDYNGAAQEFPRWVYSGNNVISQLVERRTADVNLFLT